MQDITKKDKAQEIITDLRRWIHWADRELPACTDYRDWTTLLRFQGALQEAIAEIVSWGIGD